MSVIREIRTAKPLLTTRLKTTKCTQSETLSFMRDPDLAAVLAFVVVGLLLSVLFPLSGDMAAQLVQMFLRTNRPFASGS